MDTIKQGYQVLIFDLDDTLYKEVDFVVSAYRHIDFLLVAEHGLQPGEAFGILTEAYDNGINPFDSLSAYLTDKGVVIPNAIAWMVNEYRNHIPIISLDDDTRTVLEHMREIDVPMYIITDGRSFTQRNKIRALRLYEYIPWENIFISEEMGCSKTDPAAFREIQRRHPVTTQCDVEFVCVGDNPAKDFIVANSLGALSVLLLDDGNNIHPQDIKVDKKHQARFFIKKFKELDDYIDGSTYF